MVESLQFFNGGGSPLHATTRHFIKVCPEFVPPSKMATLTPKSSIHGT